MAASKPFSDASKKRCIYDVLEFPQLLRIVGPRGTECIEDETRLQEILHQRDARGGALYWIDDILNEYPCLAVRISNGVGDIHFFPKHGHPGFRCIGNELLPDNGFTSLVYEGCDPWEGEETPNKFVLSFDKALRVVNDFFRNRQMSDAFDWFEL